MSEYMNAVEIAALRVPSLPRAVKNIIDKAKRESWSYRKRQGRGGGLEYLVAGLPADIQTAIREKQAAALLASATPEPLPSVVKKKQAAARQRLEQLGLPLGEYNHGLTDKQRDCAHARMALVAEVLKMHRVAGLKITAAIEYVANQINSGLLPESLAIYVPVANARATSQSGICLRTLKAWVFAYREAKTPSERMAALAPKKTRPEIPVVAITWLPEFLEFWAKPTAPHFTDAYRDFARHWLNTRGNADDLPRFDKVRRAFKKLPLLAQQRGRVTGGAYKALLPYVKRDWLMFEPNDIWVGDGHGFKAKVAHPVHGQPFQPEITAIIDAATRYVVGWSVSLAESTIAHADALRVSMSRHEPPLMYYTDNGSGPTGKMVDADITGILPRLGIDHPTGLPGNPQGRGIIERLWRTVTIPLARTYPTFVGAGADNSTKTLTLRKLGSAMNAERKGKELNTEQRCYRAMLPTFKQFMADLAAAFEQYNRQHEHRELMKASDKQHSTPSAYRAARMAALDKVDMPLCPVERDFMFRPEEIRTVSRGKVSLFGNVYFSMEMAVLHGEKVRVGYDLHDADTVLIKRMDGGFVCRAQFDGHVQAAMPVPRIEQKRKERVANIVKREQEKIAIARAELNPVIEMQPDFSLLVGNGAAIEADVSYALLADVAAEEPAAPKYKMFED